MTPDEEDDLLWRELTPRPWYREPEVLALVLIALLATVIFAFADCSHLPPDSRPAPPAHIEAHLDALPPVTISGREVMLIAWLDDPEAQVHCPTIRWDWEDGTRSEHTADCDPDERVTRHQEIKRGRLSSGEHLFKVTFSSAGRVWRAERVVPVA